MSWTGINDIYMKLNAKAEKKMTACEWSTLLFICSQTDGLKDFQGKGRKMSFSYIAEGTGYTRRQVRETIINLESKGLIKVYRSGRNPNIIEPAYHRDYLGNYNSLPREVQFPTSRELQFPQIKKEGLGSLTSPTNPTSITAPADAAPIEEKKYTGDLSDVEKQRLTERLLAKVERTNHLAPIELAEARELELEIDYEGLE